MRRVLLLLAVAAALAAPAAIAKSFFPETIPLPNGFSPEGISIGKGTTFYVGSIPTGAVYAGDLRTGTGSVLVPGATGHAATGLQYDRGLLWVSGASTGKAFVYNAKTGSLVREYQLAPAGSGPTFINDVVVTDRAAFFTDSNRAVIYRVDRTRHGLPGAASTIPLSGDFQLVAGLNLNGIDATRNGKTLLAVQTANGKLYTISPRTGVARAIDLGGVALTNGDGILLHGDTLYVVQNRDNKIAVVHLSRHLTRGTVNRTITDSDFDVPTTIDRFGPWLYAVNARFGTASGPDATYQVVQVRR